MMDDLIWVDLFDNEIGHGEKLDTHVRKQLHRAFSVFLYHDGKLLIQRRALDKYHSGGLWANSCCSHPRYGEEFAVSVQKRLELELSIPVGSCQPEELYSFVYYCPYEGLSEYEFDHVLLAEYGGPVTPNPTEIMDTRWVAYADLKRELEERPDAFSAWFQICAPRVLAHLMGQS